MTDIQQPSLFDDSEDAPRPAKGVPGAKPSAPEAPPLHLDGNDLGDGPLHHLMDSNFLQYASYVIRDRAIPELDDGLKPV